MPKVKDHKFYIGLTILEIGILALGFGFGCQYSYSTAIEYANHIYENMTCLPKTALYGAGRWQAPDFNMTGWLEENGSKTN